MAAVHRDRAGVADEPSGVGEHSADDAGPEAGKGPVLPEPIEIPGENTDQSPDGGEAGSTAVPGEHPADDPDRLGEDRFDAG